MCFSMITETKYFPGFMMVIIVIESLFFCLAFCLYLYTVFN